MAYSLVGILAVLVHIIVNIDVFADAFKKENQFPGERYYGFFLVSVIVYHLADVFWGFFYDAHMVTGLILDTTVYFLTMATSILFWGVFVYRYLERPGKKPHPILYVGILVFLVQILLIGLNTFVCPTLFYIGENGSYSALPLRYLMLAGQILFYLVLAAYSVIVAIRTKASERRHHIAIACFGLFMAISIGLQVVFPLLPMYSLGYLLGISALHSLFVQDEKADQQRDLEKARELLFTDPLTGVKSKHAYVETEAAISNRMDKNEMEPFSLVTFDLNSLKRVNDTFGHEAGDRYIQSSANLICSYFPGVEIYRAGGDEFVAFLLGEAYENTEEWVNAFHEKMKESAEKKDFIVVSCGYAIYDPENDVSILAIYRRADQKMYENKRQLKAIR